MKRPLGCVCLFFILFIRIFYVCFPPALPDYGFWQSREVYVSGQVISKKYQEINNESRVVYTLNEVRLQENSAAKSDYVSDKNNSFQNTNISIQSTNNSSQNIDNNFQNTKDDTGTEYAHNRIYCYASEEYPEVYLGSRIWMKGTFRAYSASENPGQFDSRLYYHIQGVGGSLQETELIWSDGGQNVVTQRLYELKQYFLQKIDRYFDAEYGGVIKTILLGDKSDLNQDMKQLFQEGGILHILTISGLHISMLGMNGFRLLRRAGLSQKMSAVVSMGIVILYGAMIGTQAATFRAICMFSMQMTGILLGRTYDRLTGLAVAAVLLLLEQPMYVFYSGFLLSFGAVLGITVLTPMVEQLCKDRGRIIAWFGKLFGSGIGILLATFPIQLYSYYEYPIYSMLVNVIVLPFLPYIVGFGAIVLAVPNAAAVLAVPFAAGAEGLLWIYQWVCRKSRSLPYHCLVLGAPKGWQILVYYGCLAALVWCMKRKWKGKPGSKLLQRMGSKLQYEPFRKADRKIFRRVFQMSLLYKIVLSVVFCVAVVVILWRPVSGVACSFLSVGQGDCAIVRYREETYVIDCGSTSKSNVGMQILLPCLKYYGVSEVAGVFISHADADHMNGIIQWLENYEHSHVSIGMIILPELADAALAEEFAELFGLAEKEGIPVVTVGAGDKLELGELEIVVLHPVKGYTDTEDANAYSQVLLFSYEDQSILFTGDIGAEQETLLLDELAGENIVLLKAAHHGSKYSSSEAFLEVCCPANVVLSYGVGNSYGHPHREAVARMVAAEAELWYTGRHGAIMVEMNEEIETYGFKE
ncbi:MAG: DNA internalization-related competence protein ComEC/Rec2 [Lachnospiraceae bacterium]|nr:DNA internalization-related competence protein ComEC/Rec2 [Lachnospiraceae bacterium]